MRDQPQQLADDAARLSAIARRTQSRPAARLDCHGLSHAGNVRRTNEDHFVVLALERSVELLHTNLDDVGDVVGRLSRPEAYAFVVADGVAGLVGGQFASGLTVRSVVEYLGEAVSCYRGSDAEREDEFISQLTDAVDRAHRRLKEGFGERGPATTLTMVTLVWPRAYVVHVGDSRGYYLRRGRLRQFTSDQTIANMVVDQGKATEQQARELGLHNMLASAVGAEPSPAVGLIDLEPEDVLLLCTDGLTKHVSDEQIAQRLAAAPDAEGACRALVGAALDAGGTDNVTVVVARAPARG